MQWLYPLRLKSHVPPNVNTPESVIFFPRNTTADGTHSQMFLSYVIITLNCFSHTQILDQTPYEGALIPIVEHNSKIFLYLQMQFRLSCTNVKQKKKTSSTPTNFIHRIVGGFLKNALNFSSTSLKDRSTSDHLIGNRKHTRLI